MEWYVPVKYVHMTTAYVSVSLFLMRFAWSVRGTLMHKPRWLRRFPHMNDTVLLASAVSLLVITGWQIGAHLWITVKVILVIGYIASGWFALRLQAAKKLRYLACCCALLQLLGIFYLAIERPL